jgi:acetamidase/formamidase
VNGALLSLGDTHTSQGDSEFDGTAIETSTTARLKLTLHKKGSMPKFISNLNFPLLENANEFVVHGFTYNVRSLSLPPSFRRPAL